MNIILVGFMGTGKTAVAKRVASEADMEYISTDGLIEKEEGKAINDIFSQDGEAYFRKVEKGVIEELSARDNLVVDAGGGVVLNEDNMGNLRKNGVIICLNARSDVIYERVKRSSHRPLLNVADPKGRIEELLRYRAPYYARADFQIDTSDKAIKEVVRNVRKLAKMRRNGNCD